MIQKIATAIEECQKNSSSGARNLRALVREDPSELCRVSISLLRNSSGFPGREHLLKVLAGDDQIVERLCDPAGVADEDAVYLIEILAQVEPQIDIKLARLLRRRHSGSGDIGDSAPAERILRLLDAVPPSHRAALALAGLLRDDNPRLRAKVALLLGRRMQNTRFAEERMQESDPRVRANVVESLWGDKTPSAAALFRRAIQDSNNRVVGNALLGLYRLDHPDAVSCILQAAASPSPQARSTAVWVMGQTGNTSFSPVLEKLSHDLYSSVRKNARKAIDRFQKQPTTDPPE